MPKPMTRRTNWSCGYVCSRRAYWIGAVLVGLLLATGFAVFGSDHTRVLTDEEVMRLERMVEDVGEPRLAALYQQAISDGRLTEREADKLIEVAKSVEPRMGLLTPVGVKQ